MTLEWVLSVAMLGAFIVAVRVMLPSALRERDALALGSALRTALLALFAWLLMGVGTRSMT